MGKPVPWSRRERAVEHCKEMGLTDMMQITHVIDNMAQALERDKPYEAMQAGCTWLDLTGTYRLMAVLLTDA
ncbi:hypothetical protein J2J97_32145 (plasmid) [Rhizobium bangladeshense]|nr:hypothetical protein J2J97_32145 [Rhizobium bangladeshense]